jgi:excisionase family DNA binding protein
MKKQEQIYTVAELVKALKVGPQTIRTWLRDGRLKGQKYCGREWYVRAVDLKNYRAAR